MRRTYDFPVWATQGGGLVQKTDPGFVFVEEPNVNGYAIGDEMPEDWGIIPANAAAREAGESVLGKASCGCVYHAEDGVPCIHDLKLI